MLYGEKGLIKNLDEINNRVVEKNKYLKMCDDIGLKNVNKVTLMIKNDIEQYMAPFTVRELVKKYGWKEIFDIMKPLKSKDRILHNIGLVVKQILINDKTKWFVIKNKKGRKDPNIYTKIRNK